jgi:hypothetical protein
MLAGYNEETREERALRVPFFDDSGSYGHAAAGAVLAIMPRWVRLAGVLAFIFYQSRETEPIEDKVGDIGEFATGFLGASLARELTNA